MTLVSVVIPAFRAQDFIAAAVTSAIAQSWRPLEIVVVDDASDDGTGAVLESLQPAAHKADAALRIVTHPENRGAAAALNTGVMASGGEIVSWLSADDEFVDADKTSRQVAVLEGGATMTFDSCFFAGSSTASAMLKCTGWFGLIRSVAREQRLTPEAVLLALLFSNPINGSTVSIRRAALRTVGDFDPLLGNVDADADLWMRLAALGHRFESSERPGIFYRLHPGQTSANSSAMTDGTALSRVRMLLALDRAGKLNLLLQRHPAVLAAAFRHRLHRHFPLPAQVLATFPRCEGMSARVLAAMAWDLRRCGLWDSARAADIVERAEMLLEASTVQLLADRRSTG